MKKIIILLLVFVSIGIFAQDSQSVYDLKIDNFNNSYTILGSTLVKNDNAVFYSTKMGLAYNLNENTSKIFLAEPDNEVSKDDRTILDKKSFEIGDFKIQEGMVSFTKDRKTVFFSANRKIKNGKKKSKREAKIKSSINLQIFKARVDENGDWVNLEMLPFNSNRFSTGQPALNQDDSKLYFVSDGPQSLGRTDIYVVDLFEDGTYGKPINLGPKINSKGREIFPFINKENLLYFSSDRSNAKGDLDVFACKIFDNTISKPIKLKGTFNIIKDNLSYNLENKNHSGYILSSNQAGKEVDDIYAFIDSSKIDFKCYQEITGVVKNGITNELLPNVQIMLFDNNNKMTSFLSGETDASFSFEQTCNTSFKLKGYLEGYLMGEIDVKSVNDLNAELVEIVMYMHVDPNSEIRLMTNSLELEDKEEVQHGISRVEKSGFEENIKKPNTSSFYDFNSSDQVYTVQIGAFLQNAQIDKYNNLTSIFNHLYDDGFNRYYSGIFMTYEEAGNYLKLMQKDGYQDAFVVGLKGGKRF